MGECGCDTDNVARIPGPEPGLWYVLEIYPGCTYCGTEWGLGVTEAREGTDEWRFWFAEVPVVEFGRYRMWGTTILDPTALKRGFMEATGEDDDFAELPFAFGEFVDRGGLRDAYHATRRKAEREEAEYRARVAAELNPEVPREHP